MVNGGMKYHTDNHSDIVNRNKETYYERGKETKRFWFQNQTF